LEAGYGFEFGSFGKSVSVRLQEDHERSRALARAKAKERLLQRIAQLNSRVDAAQRPHTRLIIRLPARNHFWDKPLGEYECNCRRGYSVRKERVAKTLVVSVYHGRQLFDIMLLAKIHWKPCANMAGKVQKPVIFYGGLQLVLFKLEIACQLQQFIRILGCTASREGEEPHLDN
jgi:hypothetical protein